MMKLIGAGGLIQAFDEIADWASGGDAEWVVGSPVEYSVYQEFGTSRMPAQPHFRPAIESTEAQMARFATQASGLDEFIKLTALHLEGEAKSRAPVDTGKLRASYTAQPR